MLDTRELIETPEGALLPMELAGIVVRAWAYLIDWGLRLLLVSVVAGLLSLGGHLGRGFMLIAYFLMEWFYPVIFEVWRGGATPGKKAMGLVVVNDDGTPVGFSTSLLRNLLMAADFLPMFYAAGIVSSLSHPQFKRLGDMAAGTVVIHLPKANPPPLLDATQGYLPLPPGLSVAEQRALVDFAERSPLLSPDRRAELAQQLAPLFPPSQDPAKTILQMANTVAGTRPTGDPRSP